MKTTTLPSGGALCRAPFGLGMSFGITSTIGVSLDFSASLTLFVPFDSAPIVGTISTANAAGAVTIVGGDFTDQAGAGGGLFSATGLDITFDRDGLGDGFTQGQSTQATLGIQVTDGVETIPVTLRAVVLSQNIAPTASGGLVSQTFTVGQAIAPIDVSGDFSDPGDTLTFTAAGLPAGLSMSTAGIISGTPTTAVVSASVVVTATDTANQTAQSAFTHTVEAAPGGFSAGFSTGFRRAA